MNYYNENNPKAAAWLQVLIDEGTIPAGEIDARSIADVRAADLRGFSQCHFFAGIGGWAEALRLAGWANEEPVWTASLPCQPFSIAGAGKGIADERHLWPVFAELVRAGQPTILFGEQVASAAGREWFAGVSADLEGMAYQVAGADLCAAGSGAPHIRQRLYWFACRLGHARDDQRRGWHPLRTVAENVEGTPAESEGTRDQERQRKVAESGNAGSGGFEWLSDTENIRCERVQDCSQQTGWNEPSSFERISGLPNSQHTGFKGWLQWRADSEWENLNGHVGRSCPVGFWDEFDLLPFKDGKIRRIESGTFPLVDGFPARVAVLHGFGNAICPYLAAQFICAASEAVTDYGAR